MAYPFYQPAITYFFISQSLILVLSMMISGFPCSIAFTVRYRFFMWQSTIILGSYQYFPLTMKKSSVEYTSPYSPASALAFVDFPEPGRPRMMISFLLGLSASIILLQSYYFSTNYLRYQIVLRASESMRNTIQPNRNLNNSINSYLLVQQQLLMMSFNHEQQSHDFSEAPPQNNSQVNYGNLKVLCKSPIHISIGPDYPFTIIAFIFLSVISFALYLFGNVFLVDDFWRNINFIIAVSPVSSFLYTALSNPGVYDIAENKDQKSKFCDQCKIFTSKNVHHCHNCNVCIEGLDHH